MKLPLRAFVPFAVLFFLFSCQKEVSQDTPPGSNDNSSRLKSYTEAITSPTIGNSVTTYNLSYDNSGRVTNVVSASNPGDKFVYAFPSANLFTMDLYNSGTLSIHEDLYLTPEGAIDSTFQYNNTQDSSTEKYTYNAAKQLVRLKEYDYSKLTGAILYNTVTYTYDAAGNMQKAEDTDGETQTFEYFPDLQYAPPVVLGPVTASATEKRPLLKKQTVSYAGFELVSADFSYTFDSKDRISTEKSVYTDGTVIIKTFTYF